MQLQVGVKAIIKNSKEQILLLKRSMIKYPDLSDLWDIPGGRIDPGVSLIDNLKREVMEETQLELVGVPKLIFAQDILLPEKHIIRLTYIAKTPGIAIVLGQEHTEYAWVGIPELKEMQYLDKYVREMMNLEKNIIFS